MKPNKNEYLIIYRAIADIDGRSVHFQIDETSGSAPKVFHDADVAKAAATSHILWLRKNSYSQFKDFIFAVIPLHNQIAIDWRIVS